MYGTKHYYWETTESTDRKYNNKCRKYSCNADVEFKKLSAENDT